MDLPQWSWLVFGCRTTEMDSHGRGRLKTQEFYLTGIHFLWQLALYICMEMVRFMPLSSNCIVLWNIINIFMYIYICGDIDFLLGILVYRMLRSGRKKYLKWSHSGIMMLSFVLSVIALLAVFDSNHRFKHPVANLYTLHSWFGISTIALFAFQVYLEYL